MYWLYDCANNFFEELPETVSYEYTDSRYHTVTTTGGSYCGFCYGTHKETSSELERHDLETDILPQPANGRFAEVERCTLCEYSHHDYTAAKAVVADYYGVVDGPAHTVTVIGLSRRRPHLHPLRQFGGRLHPDQRPQLHGGGPVHGLL